MGQLRTAEHEAQLLLTRRGDALQRLEQALEQSRREIHSLPGRTASSLADDDGGSRRFYKCIADASVTEALETSQEVEVVGKCFAGETVEALETRITADRRMRIRSSQGWLSVVASTGTVG